MSIFGWLPGSAFVLTIMAASLAPAQQNDLAQEANDPTASLMSFQLQGFYTPRYYNSDEDGSTIQFRAAVPFTAFGHSNIARLTLPYVVDTPSGADGVSDATIFNLTTFDRPWGRFGLGAVALFPVGENEVSAEKWALGPAVGFVAKREKLLWGAFNQNLFTVASNNDQKDDVNISTLQPVLNYSLGNGWGVGLSEMVIIYDWEKSKFTSLPLGVKVTKLIRLGKVPTQIVGSYEHNFYNEGVSSEDTISLFAKVLLPTF